MKQALKNFKESADDKFGVTSRFVQFGIIGASGVLVNLAVLSVCLGLDIPLRLSLLLGIFVSMNTNFFLNRRITFHDARRDSLRRQWVLFVMATSFGALVNYVTSVWCAEATTWGSRIPQLAAVAGVLAGMLFNFSLSRWIVFRDSNDGR